MTNPLSARVRALRQSAGLSIEQLAVASGVSGATISRIELDKHQPTLETLSLVAEGLGTTSTALIDGDDPAVAS